MNFKRKKTKFKNEKYTQTHGRCSWCSGSLMHKNVKRIVKTIEELKDINFDK